MNAVVSLLDSAADSRIRALWDEIDHDFGVHAVRDHVPYPHFSYAGAAHYDDNQLDTLLRRVAAQTAPFTVTADGLALFPGPEPVLYVPVVRTSALSAYHAALWDALAPLATENQPYYHPDTWVAHITLAQRDLTPASLAAIATRLATRPLTLTITVDNLAYIYAGDTGRYACRRYSFAKQA